MNKEQFKEKQDLNIREALFRKGVELDRKIAPNIYTIKKIYGKKKAGLCCKIFINSFESDVREEYHIGKKLHAAAPDLFIGTYELIRFTIPHPLFTTENCDCYAMTMELGVPLDQVNTSRNTYFFKSLIEDICRCLSVLHSIGYYHFDIKPQNIFLTSNYFSTS